MPYAVFALALAIGSGVGGAAGQPEMPYMCTGTADASWRRVGWQGGVSLWGRFTRGEVEAIAAVVAVESAGHSRADRRLMSIQRCADGRRVQVQTGRICGLLCGSGYTYVLEPLDGRWIVAGTGIWES